jgi:hypothetical protein
MQLLNRKARIALKGARTGLKAYGATQRACGRAAARRTTGGVTRKAEHPRGTPAPMKH